MGFNSGVQRDKAPAAVGPRDGEFISPAFSVYTSVELKLSLRMRLATSDACETHTQPVEKSIASPALWLF
jgi:hypothetical protein